MQSRPILARKCNLICSVSVKHIAFSFNQHTSFTFRCISVVICISNASNKVQILQTSHDIQGYQVSDFISVRNPDSKQSFCLANCKFENGNVGYKVSDVISEEKRTFNKT